MAADMKNDDICEMCGLGRNMLAAGDLYKAVSGEERVDMAVAQDSFYCKCTIAERKIWEMLKDMQGSLSRLEDL